MEFIASKWGVDIDLLRVASIRDAGVEFWWLFRQEKSVVVLLKGTFDPTYARHDCDFVVLFDTAYSTREEEDEEETTC